MNYQVRCPNMNHSKSNSPVKFCPNCGERVGNLSAPKCDPDKHAVRRKSRDMFCMDCGNSLIQNSFR